MENLSRMAQPAYENDTTFVVVRPRNRPRNQMSPATKRALVLESVVCSRPAGRFVVDDQQEAGGTVSAHDSHILRNAFKTSVAELQLPEAQWVEHATAMMRDLTGSLHVDAGFIDWIIRK